MDMLIKFLGYSLNKYTQIQNWIRCTAFENKIFYLATYDKNTRQYKTHIRANLLYHLISKFFKCFFIGWIPDDLSWLASQKICIAKYISAGVEYNEILTKETIVKSQNYIYCYLKTMTGEIIDVTSEFQLFRTTLENNELDAQQIADIICGYKSMPRLKVRCIRVMSDDDCQERSII